MTMTIVSGILIFAWGVLLGCLIRGGMLKSDEKGYKDLQLIARQFIINAASEGTVESAETTDFVNDILAMLGFKVRLSEEEKNDD